jgi:hypothetical protein
MARLLKMTVRLNHLNRLWPYALIVAAALLCHGLLLLNDGTYWDDWLHLTLLYEGSWSEFHDMTLEFGLPVWAYLFWGMKLMGLLESYKILAFLSILFSSFIVFQLVLRFAWANRFEALGIALLSLVFPAYQTAVSLSTLQYEFFYCLFLLAALFMMIFEQNGASNMRGLLLRALSLILFFLSFSVNSLLVFYFPFLFLLALHIKRVHQLSWAGMTRTILPRRLDFVLLPFVYWGIKKVFYPTHGLFKDYNALNLNVDSVAAHLAIFIKTAVYAQMDASITRLLEHPLAWILAMTGIYWAYSKYKKSTSAIPLTHHQIEQESRKTKWFLAFGAALLISGIFPYAAVGLSPSLSGWNTRHALLVGLPVALLIVALLRPIWISGFYDEQGGMGRRLISILIGFSLLAAFSLSTITYYVGWQARAVKDRAIMADLADVNVLRKFSVFWIDDQYPLGGEGLYRFYEWSSMFKKIWGGESHIGLQLQGYNQAALIGLKQYYIKRYNLSEFDPSGCQVELVITRGALQYSEGELVWQYFMHRFFKQDQLVDFLHGVVHIHVQLPQEEDKRCPVK